MASSDLLRDLIVSFTDAEELEVWSNLQGLSDDEEVRRCLKKLRDRDKILSFTNINQLREWAFINNKIFDRDVRNRLAQLETPINTVGKKVSANIFLSIISYV